MVTPHDTKQHRDTWGGARLLQQLPQKLDLRPQLPAAFETKILELGGSTLWQNLIIFLLMSSFTTACVWIRFALHTASRHQA